MKTRIILLTCISFFVLSCGTSKKANEAIEQIDESGLILVEHEIVGQGALYGGGEEQILESIIVINSKEGWLALKNKMNSTNNITDGFRIKNIDFDTHTVIACFDKVQPSGGFSIKVKTITESSSQVTVYISKKSPEMPAISVLTQPYEIVLIEKTNLPVITQ